MQSYKIAVICDFGKKSEEYSCKWPPQAVLYIAHKPRRNREKKRNWRNGEKKRNWRNGEKNWEKKKNWWEENINMYSCQRPPLRLPYPADNTQTMSIFLWQSLMPSTIAIYIWQWTDHCPLLRQSLIPSVIAVFDWQEADRQFLQHCDPPFCIVAILPRALFRKTDPTPNHYPVLEQLGLQKFDLLTCHLPAKGFLAYCDSCVPEDFG